MFFASDNASGAAPEIVAAVARVNGGYAASYGADAAMERVTARLRALFEAPRAAVPVATRCTAARGASKSARSLAVTRSMAASAP